MKQVILMRTDLGMSIGKMCAQAAHASQKPDAPTIVVGVERAQLSKALVAAQDKSLKVRWIFDAGHTEVPPETLTCGSVYGKDSDVDKITGQLPLL